MATLASGVRCGETRPRRTDLAAALERCRRPVEEVEAARAPVLGSAWGFAGMPPAGVATRFADEAVRVTAKTAEPVSLLSHVGCKESASKGAQSAQTQG